MPSKSVPLFPSQIRILQELGERLRTARLRRRFSAELVAQRCGVTRQTLTRVEKGDPSVTIGVYMRVLGVLNMEKDLTQLAAVDPVGQRIRDAEISKPRRQRAPKREIASVVGPAEKGNVGAENNWSVADIDHLDKDEEPDA